MAIVKGAIQATGSIKGLSFYTMEGSDKIIMRTKGGAAKNRIATGKEFEKLRNHQQEWGGCVLFARAVKDATGAVCRLADFNLSPHWTGMGKKLIGLDTAGEVGKRSINLSLYREVLDGFSFNRKYPFNTVLRVAPVVELSRETLSTTVSFPRINTQSDIYNLQKLPYFRLIVSLGAVSDCYFSGNAIARYGARVPELQGYSQYVQSEWFSCNDVIAPQTYTLSFDAANFGTLTDDVTLLVCAGIEFGTTSLGGTIAEVRRAGCGKIVGCR